MGQLLVHTHPLLARLAQSPDRLTRNAIAALGSMHEVAKALMPQIVQWITTGVVAKGKIFHSDGRHRGGRGPVQGRLTWGATGPMRGSGDIQKCLWN